jgi:hypothetical protein
MSRAAYPQVYRAINRVAAELARIGIPKLHANLQDQYLYRSIDDVMARLAPLLAKNGLCVLPRVLKCEWQEVESGEFERQVNVRLLVEYDLVSSRDGSMHGVRAWGEALDSSDKGTAKAMSAAYKSAMLQLFCIPVAGEDADAKSLRVRKPATQAEPLQGWDSWSVDIQDLIQSCETTMALDRLRSGHAKELSSLKRARPDLYEHIGKRFAERCTGLAVRPKKARKTESRTAEPVNA